MVSLSQALCTGTQAKIPPKTAHAVYTETTQIMTKVAARYLFLGDLSSKGPFRMFRGSMRKYWRRIDNLTHPKAML